MNENYIFNNLFLTGTLKLIVFYNFIGYILIIK